ncbi:hypothetical protein [Natrinema caseinilyticum]|uniref:hypothetical protein n=1 Tax=Natrinema caseinilyticum TaxID=2961570 RepID=UPI0020C54CDC|nr:hypothetical protein [Natrinema caseinilyticum]
MALYPRDSDDDLLVCADVLGAFGVTATDIERESTGEETLEAVLADAFADRIDRRTVLRRLIARCDRGVSCAARYSQADLERELEAVFESVGWSLTITATRTNWEVSATDPRGRHREASVTYPETPLGSHNLPAVLRALSETLLAGTGVRFVLLSSGSDRWQAALIETGELEHLRGRYGRRIDAVDRPLLPENGLEAYVPTDRSKPNFEPSGTAAGADADTGTTPWPSWALEEGGRGTIDGTESVESLIEEAECEQRDEQKERPREAVSGGAGATRDASAAAPATAGRTATDGDFGTLSGPSPTERVANDAFGTDVGCQSDGDSYRALGAALDAGGTVASRGLLANDAFFPTLPTAELEEIRIEFADEFDPAAVRDAKSTADRSGFEWVDASSLEPTRASNS